MFHQFIQRKINEVLRWYQERIPNDFTQWIKSLSYKRNRYLFLCECSPFGDTSIFSCVVLLSVTEHLSPDYQLPKEMSPHLGGTHPLMTAQEWIPVHQAPSEWCPSFTADFNPGPVIPHCQGNPSLCHQIWYPICTMFLWIMKPFLGTLIILLHLVISDIF